jgi:hypothetical protein
MTKSMESKSVFRQVNEIHSSGGPQYFKAGLHFSRRSSSLCVSPLLRSCDYTYIFFRAFLLKDKLSFNDKVDGIHSSGGPKNVNTGGDFKTSTLACILPDVLPLFVYCLS